MYKESIIGLQKIDCNCNDCVFMIRNVDRFKQSLIQHEKWQLDYFNTIKNNLLKKAKWWTEVAGKKAQEEGNKIKLAECVRKSKNLIGEAESMRFQFDKSTCSIQYGTCSKFSKDVSFIPNTCQLDTQQCFSHRRN